MNIAIDQLSKATKTQTEAQIQALSTIAEKAMHAVTELAELNVATVKASLEDGSAIATEIMAAKDPQAALIIVQSLAQPSAEKAVSYSRHLASIATKAQAELGKVAQERMAETSAHFNALINDLSKAAPAGSEPMVDMVRANVANFNAMFEQFTKVGQSAYDQFQTQMGEMGNHFGVSAKAAKAKKAAATV
jgi:phasin family protein